MDTRITLHKLEVLELVAEIGVSRAAERLFVAQPVVTAHIRSLEERLGVKLFYRDGRHTRLTEAGREVHGWAIDVLRRTRELGRYIDDLADGSCGSVAVASSQSLGSYLLPPLLTRFRCDRPQASITLKVLDSEHAVLATEAGETDFSIVVSEGPPANRALVSRRLGEDRLVLVTAADGEPASAVVTLDQLSGLPFVDTPEGTVRRNFVERTFRERGLHERNVVIELGNSEALKLAVREGAGVAMLFRSAVEEELERGVLRLVEIEGTSFTAPVHLVQRKDKQFSALQHALIEFLAEELTARQPA